MSLSNFTPNISQQRTGLFRTGVKLGVQIHEYRTNDGHPLFLVDPNEYDRIVRFLHDALYVHPGNFIINSVLRGYSTEDRHMLYGWSQEESRKYRSWSNDERDKYLSFEQSFLTLEDFQRSCYGYGTDVDDLKVLRATWQPDLVLKFAQDIFHLLPRNPQRRGDPDEATVAALLQEARFEFTHSRLGAAFAQIAGAVRKGSTDRNDPNTTAQMHLSTLSGNLGKESPPPPPAEAKGGSFADILGL